MKNLLLISLIITCFSFQQFGQTFQIDFKAVGSTVIIDSVFVENLTKSTDIMCYSDDTLNLIITTGVEDPVHASLKPVLFPNPMLVESHLAFYAPQSGEVSVVIYSITGSEIIRIGQSITSGWQDLRIEGLKRGVYLVNIEGNSLSFTCKLMSISDIKGEVHLDFSGSSTQGHSNPIHKKSKGTRNMVYELGDNLRFTGFSGVFVDTIYDSPVGSKSVTFIFSIQPASITTIAISAITQTSAEGGGNITSDGGSPVTARGICWSTNPLPTTADFTTLDGSGTGSFTSLMTGLSPSTLYHVRAYSTNSAGTSYGNQQSFTTDTVSIPMVTTTAITNITATSASSGGEVLSDGGSAIISRGVCWSSSPNPTTADPHTTNGTGVGVFTSNITGLTASTTYYVKAYATNMAGTAYGNEFTFSTISSLLSIGDSYQGGIVAYILQPGDPGYDPSVQHGLIAAPTDQSTGIEWYNGVWVATGATATALGTGNTNTNTIVSVQGTGNYAASLCYNLVLNSYSDWYLPSQDELNKLFINRTAIGGFSNSFYWSSTEWSSDYAWGQTFSSGNQSFATKYYSYYVRAIRSF